MAKIKIVKEYKREIKEIPPPPPSRISYHKWDSDESKMYYNNILQSNGVFDIYISKKAENRMMNHALSGVPNRLEVMGLMVGDLYQYEGKTYTVLKDITTTDLDATAIHVQISKDEKSYQKLFEQLDAVGGNYILVGWYHSHPGHTCFLSETDINTHKTMFPEPYQSAIVIDPLSKQFEVFALNNEGGYVRRPHAIYWDEFEEPYSPEENVPQQYPGQYTAPYGQQQTYQLMEEIRRKEEEQKRKEYLLNLRFTELQTKLNEVAEKERMYNESALNISKWKELSNQINQERANLENEKQILLKREMEVNRHYQELANKENEINKRMAMLSNQQQLDEKIKKEIEDLNIQRANLEMMSKTVLKKDDELHMKESALQTKEKELAELGMIPSLKEELEKAKQEVSEKERALREKEEMLNKEKEQIMNRERDIKEIEDHLNQQNNILRQKEKELQAMEMSIKTKETELASKELKLESLKDEIESREHAVALKESTLNELRNNLNKEIEEMKNLRVEYSNKEKELIKEKSSITKERAMLDNLDKKLKEQSKIINIIITKIEESLISSGSIKVESKEDLHKWIYEEIDNKLNDQLEKKIMMMNNIEKILKNFNKVKPMIESVNQNIKNQKRVKTVWKKAAK
ncbi:MAG: Mov34/MPN/PAD-1 family protein [Thermoplasmata archaeon]